MLVPCWVITPQDELQRVARHKLPGLGGLDEARSWDACQLQRTGRGGLEGFRPGGDVFVGGIVCPPKVAVMMPEENADGVVCGADHVPGGGIGEGTLLVGAEDAAGPWTRVALAMDLEDQFKTKRLGALAKTLRGVEGVRVLAGDELFTAVVDPPQQPSTYAVGGDEGRRGAVGAAVYGSDGGIVEPDEDSDLEGGVESEDAVFLDDGREQAAHVRLGVLRLESLRVVDLDFVNTEKVTIWGVGRERLGATTRGIPSHVGCDTGGCLCLVNASMLGGIAGYAETRPGYIEVVLFWSKRFAKADEWRYTRRRDGEGGFLVEMELSSHARTARTCEGGGHLYARMGFG